MTLKLVQTGTGKNNVPPGALAPSYTDAVDLSADTVASISVPSESDGQLRRARWLAIVAEEDFFIDLKTIPTVNPLAATADGTAPMKNVVMFGPIPDGTTTIYFRSVYAQQLNCTFYL